MTEGETSSSNCFSPLHEGDTSVAPMSPWLREVAAPFQSPSRGGHLCGRYLEELPLSYSPVSVPFTRGTPLWLLNTSRQSNYLICFSPLHEGDTSVAPGCDPLQRGRSQFQSPSRGGHLCGPPSARPNRQGQNVSVPFTRGTPLWLSRSASAAPPNPRFQSPSRGGHLCG